MKSPLFLCAIFLFILLLVGCSFNPSDRETRFVNPSTVVITEERAVSGFTGIDIGTFGRVSITQGDRESLKIKGSDNVVPLILASVQNGVLLIRTEENINVTGMTKDNALTFEIMVKDLTHLTIRGSSKIAMDALSTTNLEITLCGAGQLRLGNLSAEALNITNSGVGSIEMAGEVTAAKIILSGAGNVIAPDLRIQTANVTVSGIGNAELWTIEQLAGTISSVGDVAYYGDPFADTKTSSVGEFKSLGNK